MNLFKKIVFIGFLYLVFPQNVSSNDKIVYLDLDFILSNTNIGKTVLQKLKSNENQLKQEYSELIALNANDLWCIDLDELKPFI